MLKNQKHIEALPELDKEAQVMISGTYIAWEKSKDQLWEEMEGKLESYPLRPTKLIYLQLKRLAVAAVLLILAGIPSIMLLYTKTIDNSTGKQLSIILPDDSKVTINTQSSLSYKPLIWNISRTVKFEGEAFFNVQKGKKFEVVSKKGQTVVLGTQFDIYSRNNEYNVTCVSGKVKVIGSAHQSSVIIIAGQKAILKPDGTFEIQVKNNAQPEIKDETRNKTLEDELENVLSGEAIQDQTETKKRNQVPATEKEQATNTEQDKASEQNTIKEQSSVQNKTNEKLQNKIQPKTATQIQTEKTEQGLNQYQAKTKDQNTGNQQSKEKFRSSLTPAQINILENQQMSKEEKSKAFMESLTPEQRKLLDEQNKERTQQKEGIKNESGVNDKTQEQQKMQMREQIRESTGKESIEQQKQQNLENKENAKPNNENEAGEGSGRETGKGN